jgi:hypothetical protein
MNRRVADQASLGINPRTYLKTTKVERAGRMALVIEHLPSKCKAPSSNPSAAGERRGKERKGKEEGREKLK